MSDETPLCECGCGQRTRLSFGGKTQRFVLGHSTRRPVEVRLWEKVDRSAGEDACWLWTGAASKEGYGHLRMGDGYVRAHRLAYELLAGPIPDGLELDHLCVNPACVNPAHLEPVTGAENTRRAGERSTTCRNGLHRWSDPGVTYIAPSGKRRCRACINEGQRRARAATKEVRDGNAA